MTLLRRYTPAPIPAPVEDRELAVGVKISTPAGWLALEDEPGGYFLHAECFNSSQTSLRRQSVDSPWVAGSYDVVAVADNVTEPLAVWVRGTSHWERESRASALTEAVKQPSWQLVLRYDDVTKYWTCQPSEFSVEMNRDFAHALLCLVRVQVRRLPTVITVPSAIEDL